MSHENTQNNTKKDIIFEKEFEKKFVPFRVISWLNIKKVWNLKTNGLEDEKEETKI